MRTISVRLSASGVRQAISELRDYQAKVQAAAENIVKALCEAGEQYALAAVLPFSQTGQLASGIKSEVGGNVGYVKCSCGYAVYVEFGTGIKGAGSPHPDMAILGWRIEDGSAVPNWKYDHKGHGNLGWWYLTDSSDPNPYKYQAKNGTLYAWTKGMPSRPFMYETAQMLRASVIQTARSVLT